MSIDRGMDKEDAVHTYSGILLGHKEWNNATCNNMDEPRDYRTEWSQTNVWYPLYVKSKRKKKKTQMNLFPKQKLTDTEYNFMVTKAERGPGEG